jgi:hypothetical protein
MAREKSRRIKPRVQIYDVKRKWANRLEPYKFWKKRDIELTDKETIDI